MRTDTPPQVRLSEYTPYPFRFLHVALDIRLHPTATRVVSKIRVARKTAEAAPLRLDGEKLVLRSVRIDGRALAGEELIVDADGMTIQTGDSEFLLEIETEIAPESNTELSGLYMSSGRYCTQCEAEGFRRITYYPDRPDVLAPFAVRIEADKARYPYLLSNGNPVDAGDLAGGSHYAVWDDPHPKPSYLFALVGGDFDVLRDGFTTMSGRKVDLAIYVEQGDGGRAAFAMESLKKSMRWDEEAFGREYDLDIFQIVAVRDFNFGAMENKGLNIFNSAYVLADGDTATDGDFEAIESIVAHEYFHNWTGNRITCRDWFQLCLKEGLTVFRDQEFTKAMRSPAVARIKEVIRLRGRQFAEDTGPLAHPVRPSTYARIDNLYTATVYEKGAELVRMLRLMLGDEAFFAGVNRYFDTYDGTAATIEDFVGSFQASTTQDLADFFRWYGQAGTPQVSASGEHDAASRRYTLTLSQHTAPTPGQPVKQALPIPMRVALFDANGSRLETTHQDQSETEHVILLTSASQTFAFDNVASIPVPSLNRGFSAPIRLADGLSEAARIRLAGFDDDPFAQWDALQTMERSLLLDAASTGAGPDAARLSLLVDALDTSVRKAAASDPAFAALLLHVPTVGELTQEMRDVDPDKLHAMRTALRQAVSRKLEDLLVPIAGRVQTGAFDASAASVGRRSLRSMALSLLSARGAEFETQLATAFETAPTMTESLAALTALSSVDTDAFDFALGQFEKRWSGAPLVMDKWYSVQSGAVRDDIRERLTTLAAREDYDLRNPNRVRALAATFSMSNPVKFHAADGWGYRFVGDLIARIDPINSALSARLSTSFESWRTYDEPRRKEARAVLEQLASGNLSRNAMDIVARALGDGG